MSAPINTIPFTEGQRVRREFSKIKTPLEIPNLIELQRRSYDKFLQADVPADKRANIGLQAVFKSIFPIEDFELRRIATTA